MTPTHRYGRPWSLLRPAALLFLAAIFAQSLLTWLRLLVTLIERARLLPVSDFWRLAGAPLPALLASLLTLGAATLLALLAANLLPPLSVTAQGPLIFLLRRPRLLFWEQIEGFYIKHLGDQSARTVVWVHTRAGMPWHTRLLGRLLGAGNRPGFLIASDLPEFRPVLSYLLQTLEQQRGAEGVPFDEQPPGPLLATVLLPDHYFALLWPKDEQGRSVAALPDSRGVQAAALQAAIVALALPLVVLAEGLTDLRPPLGGALLLFVLGMVEWLVASYWLVAIGDFVDRAPRWSELLRLYPATQRVRWIMAALALALLLLQAPWWAYLPVVVAALLWSGGLLRLLTEHLYNVTDARSWLGAPLPLFLQLLMWTLFVYLLR